MVLVWVVGVLEKWCHFRHARIGRGNGHRVLNYFSCKPDGRCASFHSRSAKSILMFTLAKHDEAPADQCRQSVRPSDFRPA